jgi:hypothetical protein
MLSNIEFIKTSGGLNRRQASEDGVTGLLYYGVKPAAFGAANVKQVFSLENAEALGVTSTDLPVLHYHVEEFYRLRKGGELWIGIYGVPVGTHTFSEIETVVNESESRIKVLGIYTQKAFDVAQCAAIQTVVAALETQHKYISVLLAADISAVTLTSLPDLKTAASRKVSVVIGQDEGGKGAALYTSQTKSITCLGATLATVANAFVHESIAWVGKFNVSGAELDIIGFAEGSAYRGKTTAEIEALDNKGYIFLQKHIGISGTYFNGSWTASNGDYDSIEKNRAVDKAIRLTRAALLPFLSSPLYVDPSSGKLSEDTIQALQAEANRPIESMAINGELSGARAFIDPDQDVLGTDLVEVATELVPVGVARVFRVKIGFTPKLSS